MTRTCAVCRVPCVVCRAPCAVRRARRAPCADDEPAMHFTCRHIAQTGRACASRPLFRRQRPAVVLPQRLARLAAAARNHRPARRLLLPAARVPRDVALAWRVRVGATVCCAPPRASPADSVFVFVFGRPVEATLMIFSDTNEPASRSARSVPLQQADCSLHRFLIIAPETTMPTDLNPPPPERHRLGEWMAREEAHMAAFREKSRQRPARMPASGCVRRPCRNSRGCSTTTRCCA